MPFKNMYFIFLIPLISTLYAFSDTKQLRGVGIQIEKKKEMCHAVLLSWWLTPLRKQNSGVRQEGRPQTTLIKVTAGWSLSHLARRVPSWGQRALGSLSKQNKWMTVDEYTGKQEEERRVRPAWCVWWTPLRGCCRCSEPEQCHRTARPPRLEGGATHTHTHRSVSAVTQTHISGQLPH